MAAERVVSLEVVGVRPVEPVVRALAVGSELFAAYIRQRLVGRVVSDGEVVNVTIYAENHQFILSAPQAPDTSYLVTKE